MKKFMENPLGFMVGAIISLVLLTAFLPQIIAIAGTLVVLALAWRFARSGRADNHLTPSVCMSCGHPAHQHRWCTNAICRCSA